jgi:GT2 family glycosyltransferase
MAQQILQHAPAPVAEGAATPTTRQGYIDFYGYHTISGGWVFVGWIDLPPANGEPHNTVAMRASFEQGEAVGEAVAAFYPRADLGPAGLGMIAFLPSAGRTLGRLSHVEVSCGRAGSALIVPTDCPQLRGQDIAARLLPTLSNPEASNTRSTLLTLLSRRGYNGEDTLRSLKDNIYLEFDEFIHCRPRGAALIGWIAAAPGVIKSVRFRSGLNSVPIDLDRAIRVERPDVVKAVEDVAADLHCGFITYLPDALHDESHIYVEVETHRGEVGFKNLPTPKLTGMAAIKRLLDCFDLTPQELEPAFDHIVGPSIALLNRERLKQRPNVAVAEFGAQPHAPRHSVIVPLYGRMDFLEYQMGLFAIGAQPDCEYIYVLDDPAARRELQNLAASVHERFRLPFRLLMLDRNMGFAPANNIGLAHAQGDFVCFVNSDVFPGDPDWLDSLSQRLLQNPTLGLVGPVLLYEDGSVQHQGMEFEPLAQFANWKFPMHPGKGRKPAPGAAGLVSCPAITGACMMMRTALAREIGGFDEEFIIGDFEDSDLAMKLAGRGLACAVDHSVRLFHLERKSQTGSEQRWRMNLTLYNAWLHQTRWFRPSLMREAA